MSHAAGELPGRIRDALGDAGLTVVASGMSGDRVLRVTGDGILPAYLKIAEGWRRAELLREQALLAWLDGRGAAPRVLAWEQEGERAFLLLSAVPGDSAAELAGSWDPAQLMAVLARALRRLHEMPVGGCPFPRMLAQAEAEAEARARAGRVHLDDLDPARAGWSAQRLLAQLRATVPAGEDLVFTHGDFCLPNVLLHQGEVSGLVDWGRAGVADRYQDIALLLRSFEYNTGEQGEAIAEAFRRAYGLARLDPGKLEFYMLLDEFF